MNTRMLRHHVGAALLMMGSSEASGKVPADVNGPTVPTLDVQEVNAAGTTTLESAIIRSQLTEPPLLARSHFEPRRHGKRAQRARGRRWGR